jgi:6-phosphogluconolactonase
VLFANYSGGSAGTYAAGQDGTLGSRTAFFQHEGSSVDARRQEAPHAHSINLDPEGRYAYVADLGLDQVLIYRYDAATGAMTPNDPAFARVKPGSGPRHFAFRPDGKYAYVINEMNSTVTAFACDATKGSLAAIQTLSTLPEGFQGGNSTAHVASHPSGRFLYGSNRGHDSIAVFGIDAESGRLTLVEIEPAGGKTPRNFGIDPTGRYLLAAGQSSGGIAVFRIDPATGALEPSGSSIKVPAPVCVQFLKPPGGNL